MTSRIKLGEITVEVKRKDIKNLHLSVHPPDGRATISAPSRMGLDAIRVFAISRIGWIRQQRRRLLAQERESPREFLDRESHYVWGRRYLLAIADGDWAPAVELRHSKMLLRVRPGATREKRRDVVEEWYRAQLRSAALPLINKWAPAVGGKVDRIFVQRMRTRWGSCNPAKRSIRLNTDLARKPRECLEYIVVHEMAHLREPRHNDRFVALLDRIMPNWRIYRDALNRLPVRHEDWGY